MRLSVVGLPWVVSLLALSACSSSRQTLRGDDGAVAGPFFRAGFLLNEPGPRTPRIEIGLAQSAGEFKEDVGDGDEVSSGDDVFTGPAAIAVEGTLTSARVRFVKPVMFRQNTVGFEWAIGAGMIRTDIAVKNDQMRAREEETAYGVSGGMAFVKHFAESHLGMRAGIDATARINHVLIQYELLGTYAPVPELEFLLGVRGMQYERSHAYRSDVQFNFYGPAAGVRLAF
jgi:hypothetical protein